MRTILILAISFGLANCGHLNGLLEPPSSSDGYNTEYGGSSYTSAGSSALSSHSEYNTIDYSSNEGKGFGNLDLGSFHEGPSFSQLDLHGKPGIVHTGASIEHQFQKVPIPVPQPYKVHVSRPVPVPVLVPKPIDVPRPIPIPVPHPVPITIRKPVPVPIPRPIPVPVQQPVYVKVPQPIKVPVAQPYPVVIPQPYPVHIQTPVTVGVPTLTGGGIYSGSSSLIGTAPSFIGINGGYTNGHSGLGAYGGSTIQDCSIPSIGLENSAQFGHSSKYSSDFSNSFGTSSLNSGWVGKHNIQGYDNTISQSYDSNGGYKY